MVNSLKPVFGSPGMSYLIAEPEQVDVIACSLQSNAEVRIMRGERCQTPDSVYQEWAAALQFPQYALLPGWDSLEECLQDLDWPPFSLARRIVLVQTMTPLVLLEHLDIRDVFFDILREAPYEFRLGRTRKQTLPIPPYQNADLEIVLHATHESMEELMALIQNMQRPSEH